MPEVSPPRDEHELLERARALAGIQVGEIASRLGLALPRHPRHGKGFVGQLLETALGASAASRPVPDFEALGIELKTVPVDEAGKPRESTHVCLVPLVDTVGLRWESSLVSRKLAHVLFFPVLTPAGAPIATRTLCTPLLWRPSPDDERILRRDWEEHLERIALGRLSEITARHGTYLQIRPKAASSRSLGWTIGPDGSRIPANPRGFYLRASFTARLLAAHLILPGDAG